MLQKVFTCFIFLKLNTKISYNVFYVNKYCSISADHNFRADTIAHVLKTFEFT